MVSGLESYVNFLVENVDNMGAVSDASLVYHTICCVSHFLDDDLIVLKNKYNLRCDFVGIDYKRF